MRPGVVGLCAALSLAAAAVVVVVVVVAMIRDGDGVVRLRIRPCTVDWWRASMCVAWPCRGLLCSARICVARQGCLLHTMQTGRGTAEYGARLDMYMCPSQPVHSSSLSAEQVRDTAATARTSGRLKGAGTWGAGAQVEPRPTLHEGEARKVLGATPEQASTLKPGGGRLCPGLPGTSAPSAGQAPVCFRSSQCLSPKIF